MNTLCRTNFAGFEKWEEGRGRREKGEGRGEWGEGERGEGTGETGDRRQKTGDRRQRREKGEWRRDTEEGGLKIQEGSHGEGATKGTLQPLKCREFPTYFLSLYLTRVMKKNSRHRVTRRFFAFQSIMQ